MIAMKMKKCRLEEGIMISVSLKINIKARLEDGK